MSRSRKNREYRVGDTLYDADRGTTKKIVEVNEGDNLVVRDLDSGRTVPIAWENRGRYEHNPHRGKPPKHLAGSAR